MEKLACVVKVITFFVFLLSGFLQIAPPPMTASHGGGVMFFKSFDVFELVFEVLIP